MKSPLTIRIPNEPVGPDVFVYGLLFTHFSALEQWRRQPFVEIEMPCGEKVSYQTVQDVPVVDAPCSCGHPGHWFVKHQSVEAA